MHDIIEGAIGIMAVIALASLSSAFWFIAYMLAAFLKREVPVTYCTATANSSPPIEIKVAPTPESKPLSRDRKDLPGRSCGHCGARIKTDPIRGVCIGEATFNVYACPACRKETLLPFKPV